LRQIASALAAGAAGHRENRDLFFKHVARRGLQRGRQVIAAVRSDESMVGLVDCRQDGIARGSDMVAAEIPTQVF